LPCDLATLKTRDTILGDATKRGEKLSGRNDMGRRIDPASICKAAAYLIVVPFVSSIVGFFVCMTGKAELVLLAVPLVAVLIYAALYRKINV
jgi:hypothetical protein